MKNVTSILRLNRIRLYSNKKHDTFFLAGALGLLSPSRDISKGGGYKPSLFRTLQKGPVSEEYKELKEQTSHMYSLPSEIHKEQIDSLLADLNRTSDLLAKKDHSRDILQHVRSLKSEAELVELLRSSYRHLELSFQLFVQILLNKHLKDISLIPFGLSDPDCTQLKRNGWTKTNFTEAKILFLKKFNDMQSPLNIIKLLKSSFHGEFLPLIKNGQLSPFYERIVWKFYFEYIGLGKENTVIEELNSMRSSFLIWEASSTNNGEIIRTILKYHDTNDIQRLFLKIVASEPVQAMIESELNNGRSHLLSALKRLSVKFKIYDAKLAGDVASRAYAYSLIHKLESIVQSDVTNWSHYEILQELMAELRSFRADMIKSDQTEAELHNFAQYVH